MSVKNRRKQKAKSTMHERERPFDKLKDLPAIDTETLAELAARVKSCSKPAVWVVIAIDVYLIASIVTPWTGALGRASGLYFLDTFGGSILFLLLFLGYLCASYVTRSEIERPFSQFGGTVGLALCSALMLGLWDYAGGEPLPLRWMVPGKLGSVFATWTYENIGPLGTMIVWLLLLAGTLVMFGFSMPSLAIPGLMERIESFRFFGKGNKPARAKHEKKLSDPSDSDNDDETMPGETDELLFGDMEGGEHVFGDRGEDEPAESDFAMPEEDDENPYPMTGQFPPPVEIYGDIHESDDEINEAKARPWGDRIIESLRDFGVEAELAETLVGPTVIQFRIQPAPGVKVSRVSGLANDLALALAVPSLRVEAPIPGLPYVGIEIPNPKRRGITLRSILSDDAYQTTDASLPLPVGVTVDGDALVIGMEDLPHLLVAGTTGSGKSVFVNSCIIGLCSMRRPDELKMILVDPKRVEMAAYEKLPHILTPPVTDPKKAVHVLAWALREMEKRYTTFAGARVRNLASYNELVPRSDRFPHIVIVVDELADLMMTSPKEVEEYICRLAQMARATGIHLMLATQRPSVNVITGLIKANIPARVTFSLPSLMDSRTIIDSGGAEKLLGKGDMLFLSTKNPRPIRIQAPWIDDKNIAKWLDYMTRMFGEPIYTDIDNQTESPSGFEDGTDLSDALLEEAIRTVLTSGMASASGLQRRLRVGYSRAGRLIDTMEQIGIVSGQDGSKPREILVDEDEAFSILEQLKAEGA